MKAPAILAMALLAAVIGPARADVDLKRAEELVNGRCFLCHGATGESSSPLYPKLAGQHVEYIEKQLRNFKSGERKSTDMKKVAAELEPSDIKALAAFFSRQKVAPGKSANPEMREVGKYIYNYGNQWAGLAACVSCHGEKGVGSPKLPRIASQHALYIENQLKLFEERERTNDNAVMQGIAAKMSELEVKAVAEYLSSLD
ncbi:c-type cytochrome [Sulfurisoma sediminicola]|uniref:Cytochrome c553 n=1 Tax=Sulfurisoma sediminicola TaxID=1381557 RepID=A0A497XJD2_9PROT|nr:c-type cytochrome [Sulfurisoma sediminicola]RLJ67487.1 cytochrome c553 [Sulfurisoma sediminicola]